VIFSYLNIGDFYQILYCGVDEPGLLKLVIFMLKNTLTCLQFVKVLMGFSLPVFMPLSVLVSYHHLSYLQSWRKLIALYEKSCKIAYEPDGSDVKHSVQQHFGALLLR
jgi:hypothetical protein